MSEQSSVREGALSWRYARWVTELFIADFRAGRHLGLLLCLVFAIFSMISLQWLSSALKSSLLAQTHQVLATDAILQSHHPLTERQRALLNSSDIMFSETMATPTVVLNNERTLLVGLKGVDQHYPLKPEGLHTAHDLRQPGEITAKGPQKGEVWVEDAVLFRLGLKVGDRLSVGHTPLTITRIIRFEADRSARLYAMAPRVMIAMDDLYGTGIIHPASRVVFKTLIVGEFDQLEQLKEQMEPMLDVHQSIKSPTETRPGIKKAIDRVESFLMVTGLIAAMLALTSMFLVMDRYVKRTEPTVAMLRCSGMSRAQLIILYALHGTYLLCIGLTIAIVLAFSAYIMLQYGLERLWGIALIGGGGLLSVLAAVAGTSLVALGLLYYKVEQLLTIPAIAAIKDLKDEPATAIRINEDGDQNLENRKSQYKEIFSKYRRNVISFSAVSIGFVFYCLPAVDNIKAWFSMLFAVIALVTIGYGLAWTTMTLLGKQVDRLPMVGQLAFSQWRALRRLNLFQSTLFGIIITCFMLVIVLKEDMFERWQQQLPPETPNYFLTNLFEEQRAELKSLLEGTAVTYSHLYPIVRGRLIKHNGEGLRERVSKEERRVNALERELSITWSERLPESNIIEVGDWWTPEEYGKAGVSIESELAEKLNIVLGDRLTFSFAGEEVEARVASIRSLDWNTFKPNFYVMFAPGFLDDFEVTYMASLFIPSVNGIGIEGSQDPDRVAADIGAQFPQVSLFSIDYLLQQVRSMIDHVGRALYVALGYLLLAALLVLGAALIASWDERVRSGSVLRTLGASKYFLRKWMLFEYLFIGLAVVVVATVLVEVTAAVLAHVVFSMPIALHPWVWGMLLLLCTLFFTSVGLLTQQRVLGAWRR